MKNLGQTCGAFLRSGLLFLGVLLIGCTAPVKIETPAWQSTRWNDETAWVADSGEWRAIVSVDRARLIYLGPKTGDTNLLYAPPLPQEYFRPRGGHIFWLGPQAEWTGQWGTWPPPAEWEQQAAASARPEGHSLHLTLPRPDKNRPQLKRSYRWENDALLCEVSWSGGTGDYQAIQILQLPLRATVEARRLSENAPGFVRFDTKGKQGFEPKVLGEETTLLSVETVRLTASSTPSKFGFRHHTLDAHIDGYGLELARGELRGVTLDAPDRGFETQVFLGNKPYPFVEIEQLTPRLKNRGATENAFTIRLSLRRLAPVP
ncbi:MAG: hypothetical protein WC661_03340 [Opitutaceae bacterium]|jgi:hypothetical protein